ncbi:iron chelate uptake ABC transporter family permease subunit [Vibrio sp. M60_M31a]
MGISAGAGLAATTLLADVSASPDTLLTPKAALVGGFAAAGMILLVSYKVQPSAARLALIGIAIQRVSNQLY